MVKGKTEERGLEHSDIVRLLWTGGWDSTFRLLQLILVEKRSVQPYYVLDRDRRSTMYELSAIATISKLVRKRSSDPSLLWPVSIVLKDDIPIYEDIKQSFYNLRRDAHLGEQYLWLACLLRFLGLQGVEIGLHKGPVPRPWHRLVYDGLSPEGLLTPEVRLRSNPDVLNVFGGYDFPLLHLTKVEMSDIAAKNGFLDIMSETWFCLDPLLGKPCGRCTPCRQAKEERNFPFSRLVFLLSGLRKTARKLRKVFLKAYKKCTRLVFFPSIGGKQ